LSVRKTVVEPPISLDILIRVDHAHAIVQVSTAGVSRSAPDHMPVLLAFRLMVQEKQ